MKSQSHDYVDQILPFFDHHLPIVDKRGHFGYHLPFVHVDNSKFPPTPLTFVSRVGFDVSPETHSPYNVIPNMYRTSEETILFLNFEFVENSNSCHNISIFYYLINWIFAAETIQGRKTMIYIYITKLYYSKSNSESMCLLISWNIDLWPELLTF